MGAILSISSPNNIFEWMAFLAEKYSSMFLQGTWITLYVSVIGTIVGFILGYIVGIVGDIKIHKEDNPIKKGIIKFFKFICFLYVELFRGTPMIVQAMIVYFGLRQGGVNINPIIAGILVTVRICQKPYVQVSNPLMPDSVKVLWQWECRRCRQCSM